jgi:hypothetical protein
MDNREQEDPPAEGNPFTKYVGILPVFPGGKDEINAWIRDLRDDENATDAG